MGVSMIKKISIVSLMIIIFLVLALNIHAYPPLPTELYGNVYDYSSGKKTLMVSGGVIRAFTQNNVQCGVFSTAGMAQGYYGVLSCVGDDNVTTEIEGASPGETIKFTYDNVNVSSYGANTFSSAEYHVVNIIYPKIFCGDNICMRGIELCGDINSTDESIIPHPCQKDCQICPLVNQSNATKPNQTTNGSTSGGGGAAGSGAGGGSSEGSAGGSSASASGGGAGGIALGNISLLNSSIQLNKTSCKEDWNCTDWGVCFINETQTRICSDVNNCNTTRKKPSELQECLYAGTCFDKIRNGNELGIDCGGPCLPCPGHEKEPNCFDGIKNCQGEICEGGVDCGGPCANSCEKPKQLETPIKICNKPTDLFRIDFVILYILIIIFTVIYIIIEKERERKIKKDKTIKDVEKARKYLAIERNIILFVIFVLLLLASIISYYIFFFCSPEFYTFLKFVIPAIILIPLFAFLLMKLFEYSEKNRKVKLENFLETHNTHLKKLVSMQNDYLEEVEEELSNEIYIIQQKDELKKYLDEYPELKIVYRDMLIMYDKYKNQTTEFKIEKELCDAIKNLEDNPHFQELSKKHNDVKEIYEKLAILYKAYEEKQELYNELKEKDAQIIEKKKDDKNEEKK